MLQWNIPNFAHWISQMDCGRWMDGKKFSPIAGTRLQLKLLNRDKRNFSVFLKNCSEEQRLEIVSYSLRIQRREKLGSFKEFFTLGCNSMSEEFKFDYHDIVDKMTTEREFNKRGRHQTNNFFWKAPYVEITPGKLEIVCELEINFENPVEPAYSALDRVNPAGFGSLVDELEKQLHEPTYPDWNLLCDGETIPCHRFLLGARSNVFNRMFDQTGFIENQTQQTVVKDVNICTLKDMLKFIYTDVLETHIDHIGELYAAADKYDVPELRSRCERLLLNNLSPSNAVEYFQVSLNFILWRLNQQARPF